MWILEYLSVLDDCVVRSIALIGPRCTVGRMKGDVTFPIDKTVSRQHAVFVIRPSSGASAPPSLFLIDTGSSSGVLVDNKRIAPNVEVCATMQVWHIRVL